MSRRLVEILAAALLFSVVYSPAEAGRRDDTSGVPIVHAHQLEAGEFVVLDGRLQEAAWERTVPATGFRQQEPVEGGAPSEHTEVHIAYDRNNLYIGVVLHDSDPDGIIGHQKQRDASLNSDDRFMWVLDTYLDGRSAYFFEINPAGLMGDGLLRIGSGLSLNKSWDGIWEAKVARGDYGWSAEIRIPFRTLNFDPSSDRWGVNFQRTIRRKNEELVWSGHLRNQGLMRPIHAGRLVGLSDMSQGIGLEARPYAAGSWQNAPGQSHDRNVDFGFDVQYSLTPSLRAAFTLNTDFAEVEVDQRRVNLTRFPLSYPERRQFFLEGSGVYSFSPASGVNPYFSRRIGLVQGSPIPLLYGARLGGQAGPYDIGFLQIRTGREGAVPGEQFTVARLRRNILRQSSLGVIYTRRAAEKLASDADTDLPHRHTIGTDLDLYTSSFLGNRNLQFEAFLVWHTDPVPGGSTTGWDRAARGVRLNYPNDIWRMHVSYREFGDAWDPAVGFAPRRGFRRVQPTVTFAPRPGWRPVRQLEFEGMLEHLTTLENTLETRRVNLKPLGVRFQSGDTFSVDVSSTFERLERSFTIHPGVVLLPGDYEFREVEAELSSAKKRRLAADISLRTGQFWSGNRTRYQAGMTLLPLTGLRLALTTERNDIRLLGTSFSPTLVRASAEWHASPWASVIGNVQYDDVSGLLGLYTRLRWIVRPGSDFYLVYTHNWRYSPLEVLTLSRGATSKINYTHRF
jgi:hypothetical protein